MSILSYTSNLTQEEKVEIMGQYNDRVLYLSILTFEDRHAISNTFAREFQSAIDFFQELHPGQYQMVVNGPMDREKLLTYERGWSKYKEKLVEGSLDLTTAFLADGENPIKKIVRSKISYNDFLYAHGNKIELNHSKYFEAQVGRMYFDEKQVFQVQEYFIELGTRLMSSLNAVDGIISCEPYGFHTAHEVDMGISTFEKSMLEKHIRSYGWGNFLTPINVEILGGIESVAAKAPVHRVIPMETGGAFLQLTESVDDYSDEVLLEFKKYLKPLLLERMRDTAVKDFDGQRVVLD